MGGTEVDAIIGDCERAILRCKILPGLVLDWSFRVRHIWTRAVDAIQGSNPCLIGQGVARDAKINFSLTQVSEKNGHHPIEI
jgi:hypothetical protein